MSSDCIVIASSSKGGSVQPEGRREIKKNETITFNATPMDSNIVDQWIVDNKKIRAVAGEHTFEFTVTREEHEIRVTFSKYHQKTLTDRSHKFFERLAFFNKQNAANAAAKNDLIEEARENFSAITKKEKGKRDRWSKWIQPLIDKGFVYWESKISGGRAFKYDNLKSRLQTYGREGFQLENIPELARCWGKKPEDFVPTLYKMTFEDAENTNGSDNFKKIDSFDAIPISEKKIGCS